MIVQIDPRDPVPPYEQVRAQVAAMITGGTLPPGTRLPSIRQLAADLGLATGTVARAYRELEQAGLVLSSGRRGTRVRAPQDWSEGMDELDVQARLRRAAEHYATLARQLRVAPDDAVAAIEAALAADADPAGQP